MPQPAATGTAAGSRGVAALQLLALGVGSSSGVDAAHMCAGRGISERGQVCPQHQLWLGNPPHKIKSSLLCRSAV